MRRVAKYLAERTVRLNDVDERDVFGKSAINRYYYATYLRVRKLLVETMPNKSGIGHKSIPDFLRKSFLKRIKTDLKQAVKTGALRQPESDSWKHNAMDAISTLANLLETGYHARVLADYDSNAFMKEVDGVLRLENLTIDAAGKWPDRAEWCCGIVMKVWRDLGN